ncbi:glycosyltransferase [Bremerella cremea]|nr:glycosyltransferase [Bremerella cremea]
MTRTKKRILVALYHSYVDTSSGAAISLRDLMEALASRDTEVRVLCGPRLDFEGAKTNEELLREQGIPFKTYRASHQGEGFRLCMFRTGGIEGGIWIPKHPQADPNHAVGEAWLSSYRDLVANWKPDMVITYGGFWMFQPMMDIAHQHGAKTVFFLCNCAYTNGKMFEKVDCTIVQSNFHAEWCRRTLGIEGVPLYPLIPPERYLCSDKREPKYLTFVNPQPAKGLFIFAKIAEVLQRKRPDIPLLVVEGRAKGHLLAQAGVRLSSHNLFRMANTPDPRDYLRVTKVMLVPSVVQETFGRVAAEAMINGIPVVASNCGALPEVVGDSGRLVDLTTRLMNSTSVMLKDEEIAPWIEAIEQLWDDVDSDVSSRCVSQSKRWSMESTLHEFENVWNHA